MLRTQLLSKTFSTFNKNGFATKATKGDAIKIDFGKNPYKLHLLNEGPATSSSVTKDELLDWYTQMYRIRRVEIAADSAYKLKQIRGFLHLYNGQEAVAVGFDSVLTPKDHVITAYRCHGWALTNRCKSTPKEILAELFGKKTGSSKGKGGSMHIFNVPNHFHGGNGIVGAQIPLGTGIAFAEHYLNTRNVCLAAMGDGAANQGQVYEAFNQASIYKLPVIYMVENNRYAMGTPIDKASATKDFYTRGNYIPGIQFDGMDILQIREVAKFSYNYAKNVGPILVEAMTYRYYGHSMSDPGLVYRTRDEVDQVRKTNDPLNKVKKLLLDHSLASEDEITDIEAKIKVEIDEAIQFAKDSEPPEPNDLYTDVYIENVPVRGIELSNSYVPEKKQ